MKFRSHAGNIHWQFLLHAAGEQIGKDISEKFYGLLNYYNKGRNHIGTHPEDFVLTKIIEKHKLSFHNFTAIVSLAREMGELKTF